MTDHELSEFLLKEWADDLQGAGEKLRRVLVTYVDMASEHMGDGWALGDVEDGAKHLVDVVHLIEGIALKIWSPVDGGPLSNTEEATR